MTQVKDIKEECINDPENRLWSKETEDILEIREIWTSIKSLTYEDQPDYPFIRSKLKQIYEKSQYIPRSNPISPMNYEPGFQDQYIRAPIEVPTYTPNIISKTEVNISKPLGYYSENYRPQMHYSQSQPQLQPQLQPQPLPQNQPQHQPQHQPQNQPQHQPQHQSQPQPKSFCENNISTTWVCKPSMEQNGYNRVQNYSVGMPSQGTISTHQISQGGMPQPIQTQTLPKMNLGFSRYLQEFEPQETNLNVRMNQIVRLPYQIMVPPTEINQSISISNLPSLNDLAIRTGINNSMGTIVHKGMCYQGGSELILPISSVYNQQKSVPKYANTEIHWENEPRKYYG
eukprot:CAMPEP_0205834122 /NCGR_PEP_ID=MMETSP0206-20130828/50533_1 /ASSEMBLY_ACC=CAM_ASM_000279 /TAXON_ID=36767 /ORGANISM="Euplotes focardii, Strain TN1" /LENGTH=342 /DNA_ID=CAMNT_0053140993 /DNA_START=685 /DNA_END=1713 /DNA_ORIENTATION=-